MPTTEQRFLAKVAIPNANGCMLWLGATDGTGYGQLRVGSMKDGTRRMMPAHRFSYELWVGPIPGGLQLDHTCRVHLCVAPHHLEPVTQRENLMRGETIVARYASRSQCGNGHKYTIESTYWHGHIRKCRICDRIRHKRYRDTKVAAMAQRCKGVSL